MELDDGDVGQDVLGEMSAGDLQGLFGFQRFDEELGGEILTGLGHFVSSVGSCVVGEDEPEMIPQLLVYGCQVVEVVGQALHFRVVEEIVGIVDQDDPGVGVRRQMLREDGVERLVGLFAEVLGIVILVGRDEGGEFLEEQTGGGLVVKVWGEKYGLVGQDVQEGFEKRGLAGLGAAGDGEMFAVDGKAVEDPSEQRVRYVVVVAGDRGIVGVFHGVGFLAELIFAFVAMQAAKAWVAVWWGPPVSPGSSSAWRHSKYQPSGLLEIVMNSVMSGLFKSLILCKAVVFDAGPIRDGCDEGRVFPWLSYSGARSGAWLRS